MKTKSVKAKGRNLQNFVRDKLRQIFSMLHPDDVKSQTMGMGGEDIVLSPAARKFIPYSFECKNKERLDLWKSLEQTESNANDNEPILIFKRNRSKVYVTMQFDHFIELIRRNNE